MGLSREIVLLRDFAADAEKLRASWGKTERFKTGVSTLDFYLGGGFGRKDGYEIVVVYGPSKIGKSMFCLNLIRAATKAGDRIGIMALEDDGPDVYLRFTNILGADLTQQFVSQGDTVHMMPPEDMTKSWQLEELLALIEHWFVQRELDVILVDHLQFAFENAEALRGESEYVAQRVFMQKLNQMMKRLKKTIILISHVNKDSNSKGMNKIHGSSAIAQAATKLIEIAKASEPGHLEVTLQGSRHTKTPDGSHLVVLKDGRLEAIDERWFS